MLKDFSEIIFGWSTKKDGKMKLANRSDDLAVENRRRYFDVLGVSENKIISAALAHGIEIKIVDQEDAGKMIPGVDALITKEKNLTLAITVADCAPIYFYDPVQKVIALAHAGWSGVLGNIIQKTISVLQDNFQSTPADLQVFVGPHIRVCHFEVQSDVAQKFKNYQQFIVDRAGKTFIDLTGIIAVQLSTAGVLVENTEFNQECTYCEEGKYFSWRRDRPSEVEAIVAYLKIVS